MTFKLKVHKWVFAVGITVLNIVSSYVVPYFVDTYVGNSFDHMVADVTISLVLNLVAVGLSIEEQNAPEVMAPHA